MDWNKEKLWHELEEEYDQIQWVKDVEQNRV
jgi:hypothetical protein